MNFVLKPWQLFFTLLAGWVHRQQQEAIDYLRTENRVLKEQFGKKRILVTDDQRRRLAVKGKILGHKRILEVGTLFTPDTILRWHRRLVADKWDNSDRQQPGRPRVRQVIVDLTVRFAKENPRWGCDRIQGALANVGYRITDTTVGNILKRHGIEPAPDRREGTTWSTFLKAHWDVLAASDFTTVEVWTKGGLVTFYLLFVMGANRWRAESEWPLARTRDIDFYFHSDGAANTPAGNGTLSTQPPHEQPPDEYDYDPRDPVMTLYTPPGQHEPQDQRALAGRRDVLVYATAPLTRPVEVTGPITVKLWAASSATDTDFVVKLLDVWPDGFAQELCHGIVRARYRDGFEQPSLLKAGDIYEYTIPVNPTSNLFRPGHRIRVDVSSSDFPNFDRNHNTGGNDYFESTLLTARQRIFHDPMRPSRIILPVIP